MCTKWFSDGDVHKYFNPYGTPYEAFVNFMNVLSDFVIRVENRCPQNDEKMKDIKEMAGKLMDDIEDVTKKKLKESRKKVHEAFDKNIKLDDIKNMSNATIKKWLKDIDIKELSIALKGVEKDVKDKIIPNLGKKARKSYDELQKDLNKIKKSDIKKYQKLLEEKLKGIFSK